MNEQALIGFMLHQAALPLALLAAGCSIATYRERPCSQEERSGSFARGRAAQILV